jgi:hypothetical protein
LCRGLMRSWTRYMTSAQCCACLKTGLQDDTLKAAAAHYK